MENEERLYLLADEVMIAEEAKLNPVFLSITLKLCDNSGNRNKEGTTTAFINDLIANKEKYNSLPFYADVKNLLARNYNSLGHMYDKHKGLFGTTQIGGLVDFYSEADDNGIVSLYATARVPKREKDICLRLVELYEMNQLAVSFEVRYNPQHVLIKDGVKFIDVAEDNALTGIALVSVPACIDAVALDMVAEAADDSDMIVADGEAANSERGETDMPKEIEEATVASVDETEEQVVTAEETEVVEASADDVSTAKCKKTCGEDEEEQKPDEDNPNPEDEKEKEEDTANAEDANAEVLHHSVEVRETYDAGCPEFDVPPTHVTEICDITVETVEPERPDDRDRVIAELRERVAQLETIEAEYNKIIAERLEAEKKAKQDKVRAFAEQQGLSVEDSAVAQAIEDIDYEAIASLVMAQAVKPKLDQNTSNTITLASFSDAGVGNKYGDMLNRRH